MSAGKAKDTTPTWIFGGFGGGVVVVFLFILRAKQKNCANFGGAAFADQGGGGKRGKKGKRLLRGNRKFDNVKKYYI